MSRYDNIGYVGDYIDLWAPYLERLTSPLAYAAGEHITQQSVVIDLGSGTGGLTRQLLAHNPKELLAVEPSPQMRSRIATSSTVRVLETTADDHTIAEPNTADAVTIAFMLQELSEDQVGAVLNNSFRMLRPGGRLWVATWASSSGIELDPVEALAHDMTPSRQPSTSTKMAELDPEAVSRLTSNAGFVEVSCQRFVTRLTIARHDYLRYHARRSVPNGGSRLDALVSKLDDALPMSDPCISHAVTYYEGRSPSG